MGVEAAVRKLDVAAADGALASLCERHDIDIVTLFGSARRDPASAHDVDIAIRFTLGADGDLVGVVSDLMTLTVCNDVDVMHLNRANPTARFAGLVEARPLYEAAEGTWATAQMAAALEFYETEWLRRLDLELLAR